jgi:cyclopropane fatty-acyl-phospholipid synthase-like methyltransferase
LIRDFVKNWCKDIGIDFKLPNYFFEMVYLTRNMLSKEYWENRAKTYGHTGFADPFLYCFDQEARKYAIDRILTENNIQCLNNALDFGCGSGDFFEVLLKYSQSVTGYDISEQVIRIASQRFKADKRIHLSSSIDALKTNVLFDLIISITVFQRLSKADLGDAVKLITSQMSMGGFMVCMEFFSTDKQNAEEKENNITIDDWRSILSQNQLNLIKTYSFYNPVLYPSESWKYYNHNIFLKALKPVKQLKFIQKIYSEKAKQIIHKKKDVLQPANDIFKIYVLQKQ